ncbi:MAG TPA: DHA2 family efflux MFS transporter permease subunit [Caulobacteraceae bacterium]|nr:DHA2 family efflux MFS transporter permease subunit [Caulobacteraceae bacterium]
MASAQDIKNRVPITAALMLATLMNTLDSTIANVALPHMQGSLSASSDQIFWVLTSYIIATAIMTPLAGWLSLRFGRKPMFLISISAFTVASMLCGVATSLEEMVVFRLLQGLAGAALMPLSQTVMLDIYPPAMIPRVMSIWSAAVILGPIIGPALGGWLTESYSWRWVFYINLPVGILAFLGIYLFMERDDGGRQRPFDFLGFTALAVFVGSFQLMMDRGSTQDWFNSREIWIELTVAVVAFILFLVQTLTVEHPFFHRDLAKDRNYVACTLFGMFVGVLLFSTTALLPTFMQTLLGYSALQSGYASMPRGLGSLIAFLAVPTLIVAIGPRRTLSIGIFLSVYALWRMAHFDLLMTSYPIMSAGTIQGLGTGLLFAPLNTLAYATLDPVHRTEATIVNTMTRSLGSSVGISAVQASVVRDASIVHARLSEHISVGSPLLASALPAHMDPGSPLGIQLLNGLVTRQATMVSYNIVFGWMAVGTLLLIPLLLTMRAARAGPPAVQEAHVD